MSMSVTVPLRNLKADSAAFNIAVLPSSRCNTSLKDLPSFSNAFNKRSIYCSVLTRENLVSALRTCSRSSRNLAITSS